MIRTALLRPAASAGAVAAALLVAAAPATANVPLTRVSADPFTNATSQHATEVEPDTFAFGSTVVAAFQVGPLLRRRCDRHRLRALDGRRRDLGRAGLPAGPDVQRRPFGDRTARSSA